MLKAFVTSFKVMFFGLLLPFHIWKFSQDKVLNMGSRSISNMLDEEYVVTSWMDMLIDAIIFLLYPVGFSLLLIFYFFTKFGSMFFLLIPLYLIPLIISFLRELGGSFMLLHMNVKRIRNILEKEWCRWVMLIKN